MIEHGKDKKQHILDDSWILWGHLPHDIDWSFASYKEIMTMKTMEDILALYENFPDTLIKNCMLFLMRNNIQPTWEDPKNKKGGCFSYKINNKNIATCWKNLSYVLLGETLVESNICKKINGITISPKKNFCIIKIWLSTCEYQNADIISDIDGLAKHGCLFKRHLSDDI